MNNEVLHAQQLDPTEDPQFPGTSIAEVLGQQCVPLTQGASVTSLPVQPTDDDFYDDPDPSLDRDPWMAIQVAQERRWRRARNIARRALEDVGAQDPGPYTSAALVESVIARATELGHPIDPKLVSTATNELIADGRLRSAGDFGFRFVDN